MVTPLEFELVTPAHFEDQQTLLSFFCRIASDKLSLTSGRPFARSVRAQGRSVEDRGWTREPLLDQRRKTGCRLYTLYWTASVRVPTSSALCCCSWVRSLQNLVSTARIRPSTSVLADWSVASGV